MPALGHGRASPYDGVGAAFVVVEGTIVDHVPTTVEVGWQQDRGVAAVQERGPVLELLHQDACRRRHRAA